MRLYVEEFEYPFLYLYLQASGWIIYFYFGLVVLVVTFDLG